MRISLVLLCDLIHGERGPRRGHIQDCLDALVVKPLSGERGGGVGLVLVVGEDDLYRTIRSTFAAEVIDRHACGGDVSLPADIGVKGPAMSSSRPSFKGACAEAGGENVAKRTANRKGITLIGRLMRKGGWATFRRQSVVIVRGTLALRRPSKIKLKSGQIRRRPSSLIAFLPA